eukprot:scaffold11088_cov214-Amphora_coffeaeformis.AAC.1
MASVVDFLRIEKLSVGWTGFCGVWVCEAFVSAPPQQNHSHAWSKTKRERDNQQNNNNNRIVLSNLKTILYATTTGTIVV